MDGAVERLKAVGADMQKGGSSAVAYTKYFRMNGWGCHLERNFSLWREHGISPIWFRIALIKSEKCWEWDNCLRSLKRAEEISIECSYGLLFPIRVSEGKDRDTVVKDISMQIEEIIRRSQPLTIEELAVGGVPLDSEESILS